MDEVVLVGICGGPDSSRSIPPTCCPSRGCKSTVGVLENVIRRCANWCSDQLVLVYGVRRLLSLRSNNVAVVGVKTWSRVDFVLEYKEVRWLCLGTSIDRNAGI